MGRYPGTPISRLAFLLFATLPKSRICNTYETRAIFKPPFGRFPRRERP